MVGQGFCSITTILTVVAIIGLAENDMAGVEVTQAGHKRIRTPLACSTCRQRKLKCDALRPACTSCLTKGIDCIYQETSGGGSKRRRRIASSGTRPEGSRDAERREKERSHGEAAEATIRRVAFDAKRTSALRQDTGFVSEDGDHDEEDNDMVRRLVSRVRLGSY